MADETFGSDSRFDGKHSKSSWLHSAVHPLRASGGFNGGKFITTMLTKHPADHSSKFKTHRTRGK